MAKEMRTSEMLLIAALFMLLVMLILGVKYLRDEGGKCVTKPLTYGIKQLESLNNVTITCECSAYGENFIKPEEFILTSENITAKKR